MPPVPLLEDPTYPGRSGGYVARITGKLLQEAAISGLRTIFLPDPAGAPGHFVYAGLDAGADKVYEVPNEFYATVFQRVLGIFGAGVDASRAERTFAYAGASYTFSCVLIPSPASGVLLQISLPGNPNAGT